MRIACVLAADFEDSEFRKPYDALRQAGHEVTVIGVERGESLRGKKGRETAAVDASIAEVGPDQFDALLIPGGFSPDHLRADRRMVDFTAAFMREDKPVFAVCHGPQLLISADAVRGRRMTAWKTVQVDLRYAGADVVDEQVVIDRRLVTSRQPDDLDAFDAAITEMLAGAPAGR